MFAFLRRHRKPPIYIPDTCVHCGNVCPRLIVVDAGQERLFCNTDCWWAFRLPRGKRWDTVLFTKVKP